MSGLSGMVYSRRKARLLKTSQTVQYSSELDDGYYEKGAAKAYQALTTGQYSGTSNVDVPHYVDKATVAFVAATKKITDSANGLAMFKTGDTIVIRGSASNDGAYTVATGNVAGEIVTTEALVDELAGATVSLDKRAAHSNNCVLDKNTGLMYARYNSKQYKYGVASDGQMPWTGQVYDIFAYCLAANNASLGGYTDWRVANYSELFALMGIAASGMGVNGAAFP